MLSGFLITHLLLVERERTGSIHLGRFYARRALRLLPTLLVVVALVWVVTHHLLAGSAQMMTGRELLAIMLYYVNLPLAFEWFNIGVMRHCWSLAIEEQFYLVWPPVCAWMLARGFPARSCFRILLGGVLALAVWRLWLTLGAENYRRIYFGTDTRADGLLLGCCVAFLSRARGLPAGAAARGWFLGGLALFAGMVALASTGHVRSTAFLMGKGGFLGSTLGAACTLPFLLDSSAKGSWLRRPFEHPTLIWIGKLSYALYLIHLPVFVLGNRVLRDSNFDHQDPKTLLVSRALQFLASFALAALVYHGLEHPLARLRKRYGSAHLVVEGQRPRAE